jgi:phosphotransacetylase
MERIVIEVTDSTAKKWRLASQQKKNEISQRIDLTLAKELSDSKEEFKKFLDELGTTMQERGLTEEALREILKDDE